MASGGVGRVLGAVFGIGFGLLLLGGSFTLTFWNEGRSLKRAAELADGLKSVVTVKPEVPDPANDGKLVHVSGETATESTLTDEEFGVAVPQALKLHRVVEMYQWDEERKSRKGSDTYTYKKRWSESLINSRSFRRSGHSNPDEKPIPSLHLAAPDIIIGGFALAPELVTQIKNFEMMPMTEEGLAKVSPQLKTGLKLADGVLYQGPDPASPAIGDVRVTFKVARPGAATVVARQAGLFLEPTTGKSGGALGFFQPGTITAKDVFDQEVSRNTLKAWLLRGAALLIMWIGVLSAVFSLRGNNRSTKGNGVLFLLSVFMALALSVVSIAVSWLVYRPAAGAAILAVGLVLVVLIYRKLRSRNRGSRIEPPAPMPIQPPPPPPPPVPSM